ncbi:MAG: sodium:solute symporter [Ignavibacteria bacterium GWA2_55_11]|nr:MAG: sodium:solute symporter [Ignavibacteria bacterium GWA2_55_11]OGU63453.1 MAG: sodium:solute symporter [Ignavibacteria bacterium RIFCSPHIGHO2_02_FULL_56_12]OGU72026.1 MAG: sodium:solute symporter [Ignavibacteria bacterium RIFCSPLOWO2_02_FULL_55_14]OGU73770.1 MAG: sodium:solute symporter [Ignavibacteria bacterium RIFCSPLOWO2_12_FULL_56_21]
MRTLDILVLVATLGCLVAYGVWKGRGSRNVQGFLLADRRLPWYAVALSIMATQASAITFTSTPGQAYADGMRFVQYYFGLPIAMVILCVTVVPLYRKLGVFTAYEFLEHRFDLKTRALTAFLFLVQRGLGAGMTIYAPSLILSVMLGWDIRWTSAAIGGAIIIYMTTGGVKAVNWADVQQLTIIMAGMMVAFLVTFFIIPDDVGIVDAFRIAGVNGRLNAVDFTFDLSNRYTFWSGLIGGLFIALAYFGTDQSQVQRYLTGASLTQSRLGLLFNGMAKVPMQFFILLIGVMVFVVYQFERPPVFFNPVVVEKIRSGPHADAFAEAERKYAAAHEAQQSSYREFLAARKEGNAGREEEVRGAIAEQTEMKASARESARAAIVADDPTVDPNDTNYIFLTYVLTYLPAGFVGLVFACVFAASMSSSSGELSSLATCSVVDVYKRLIRREANDRHILLVSRIAMAGWGVYAIVFSQYAARLGSLIEAVNIIGSLFYGSMLGIFVVAFFMRSVGGTAVFWSVFAGEAAVFACFLWTDISWLWYNVVGCIVVIASSFVFEIVVPRRN